MCRNDILHFAVAQVQDFYFSELMSNLSVLEEENRYYNWYHGYTELWILPNWNSKLACTLHSDEASKKHTKGCEEMNLQYYLHTIAHNGSISVQYFGDNFEANKTAKNIECYIDITAPFRNISVEKKELKLYLEIETDF